MPEAILFVVATVGNLYVSRAQLRVPGSHGFYRFLAWEAILLLLLLNVRKWVVDPLSPHQLVAWTLLCCSLYLVIAGVRLLRRRGQTTAARTDAALYEFERTTVLVTDGLYRYIRHPLYSSLLFLGWGIFFKDPTWLAGLLVLAASAFLFATARVEETENIRFFGDDYRAYMQRSKMFVPFVL